MHPTLYKPSAGQLVLWAMLCLSSSAIAQGTPEGSDNWKLSAGIGLINQPKYPGSSDTKNSTVPLFSASNDRYFIGSVPDAGVPAGVGAYLVQSPQWQLGVVLGGDSSKTRRESDSPRLAGLGDVKATALGAVFGSYSDTWWKFRGNVLTDLGGRKQGARIFMGLEANYSPIERLALTAGPGVAWADAQYNQTVFGVDAAQSARSKLPGYTAKAGINSVSFTVGANYQLTQQWGLGAQYSTSSLRGAAANSPISEKKLQNTFGVFSSYSF